MPALHLSTFECDATPPLGHPLCGGWIQPVRGVDDPLKALGVILLGMGQPVVLCVVDWTGLRNEANRMFRAALARAAHTTISRVAVHCVHQHNAPFADVGAQRLIQQAQGAPSNIDLKFFDDVLARAGRAAQESLKRTREFTHVGFGQGRVSEVASARRVLGPDGKVRYTRTSATTNKEARNQPEGLIDPMLKTVSFWNNDRALVAMHYYATHPMSYYGDGRVSADFCGLARQKRQDDDRNIFQMYFTGCAGNVTAGKYNDGNHANRPILRDRIYAGMTAAWNATRRQAIKQFDWRIEPVTLPSRTEAVFGDEDSRRTLNDPKAAPARRGNAALHLAWRQRANTPIDLTCLEVGRVRIMHLPGEPFIEYQLHVQGLRRDLDVAVAGYGDGGTGYIPTSRAYLEGGYEPTVALVGPGSQAILHDAMARLLQAKRD